MLPHCDVKRGIPGSDKQTPRLYIPNSVTQGMKIIPTAQPKTTRYLYWTIEIYEESVGCILSHLFSLYAESVLKEATLEEHECSLKLEKEI